MTGKEADFFATGNMQSAPTGDQGPAIEPGVLEDDLGLDPEGGNDPAPQEPKPAKKQGGGDWLSGLLGSVTGEEGEEGEEEDAPLEEEEEDKNLLGLPTEAQEFVSSGKGTLDDYYRQKYAPPAAQEPLAPEKSPEDIQLEEIARTKADLSEKLRQNHLAAAHAATNGTQQQWDDLMEERAQIETGLSELNGRAAFVNEKRNERQAQGIVGQYTTTFTEMLVANHGVKPEQAQAVRQKVLDDPYIRELVSRPETRSLMAIDMVRDRFIKAALYDMQYSSSKTPRRAPGDPGARPGTASGIGNAPKPRGGTGAPFSDDRGFSSFMTTGSVPKKAGNK